MKHRRALASVPQSPMHANASNLRPGEVRLMTCYQRGWRIVRAWRRLRAELHALALRARGASIGKGVFFGTHSTVYGHRGLAIDDDVNLGNRARIDAHVTERGQGRFAIGSGTRIGNDFHGGAALRVTIGRDCMVASGGTILDHDHDFSDPSDPHRAHEGVVASPVVIGDRVFLGERVTVLKGVHIGDCCVVGAHSVVSRDLPPYTMAAGIPARPISRWNLELGRWERLATPQSVHEGAH